MFKELYEINSSTCALISENNFRTKIIETNQIINQAYSLKEILNYNCEYYGSSFEGRLKGTKQALGSKYKLPIIIEGSREIIFFPTLSYENKNCIWLSLKNISNYEKQGKNVTIIFNNNQKLNLNMSYEAFENQFLRATKLLLVLKSRINGTKL